MVTVFKLIPSLILIQGTSNTFSPLAHAKEVLPITKKTKEYTLLKPDQTHCTVNLFEGNSPSVSQNQLLESFTITDIPQSTTEDALPVLITFSVTASNAITVSAKVGGKSGRCISSGVHWVLVTSDIL